MVTFLSEGQYWEDIKKCWACVPPCHQELQPRVWNWEYSQNYKLQVTGMQGPQQGDPGVAAGCHLPGCAHHTGQALGSGWLLPSATERCLLTPDNCFVKTTYAPKYPAHSRYSLNMCVCVCVYTKWIYEGREWYRKDLGLKRPSVKYLVGQSVCSGFLTPSSRKTWKDHISLMLRCTFSKKNFAALKLECIL